MKLEKGINITLIILFVIFITMFIVTNSSFYEYKLHKKNVLTEKEIQKFENDIKSGVDLDINNYINNTSTDYSNKVSDTTSNISKYIGDYIKSCIKSVLNTMGKLFA